MKKTMALVLTLAMMLTMFVGVQAFAGNPGVTVTGVYTGSTQVVATYGDEVLNYPGFNPTYIGVNLYGHATAFTPKLWEGPVNGTVDLIALNGTITMNLAEPLVEGTEVRFVIGNPAAGFVYVFTVGPEEPEPGNKLEGEGDITITPPDYKFYLLNPTGADAAALTWDTTETVTLNGLAFNFGSYQLKAGPQTVVSENAVSMIHGHEAVPGYNTSFQVTAKITDFLTNEGVSIFSEFSLEMEKDVEYFETGVLATRRATADRPDTIVLAANDPEVLVVDDVIGHSLTNYKGTLNYTSSATSGVGTASAKLIWEIGPYVVGP